MKFGTKQIVLLREIWEKEDKDFTPWLNDNIEYPNEALGLDLNQLE